MSDMVGKTALVTGATNGIGLETAKALAKMGARVLIHGRDAQRGAMALNVIAEHAPHASAEYFQADFSSLAAIRALAKNIFERTDRLDVLINNAGGLFLKRTITHDGFEMTFGVNHLAPFLLTNLLLDILKTSSPARIVIVSSMAHKGSHIDFEDINHEKRFSGIRAYQASKLANILFTQALARRLSGTGITANCLHPGVVRSGFALNNKGFAEAIYKVINRFMITAEEGAKTSIFLASDPSIATQSGCYFNNIKQKTPSREAQDLAAAEKLWTLSERLAELT